MTGFFIAFLWGAAEAVWFPIIPDYFPMIYVVARPDESLSVAAGLTLGSAVGGTVGYLLGRRRAIDIAALPLVRPRMVETVQRWMPSAFGVWRQPLSGIPFKVFVYVAAARRHSFIPFIATAVLGRGARMLAVCLAAAWIGQRVPEGLYPFWMVGFTAVFAGGLMLVVRRFEADA